MKYSERKGSACSEPYEKVGKAKTNRPPRERLQIKPDKEISKLLPPVYKTKGKRGNGGREKTPK